MFVFKPTTETYSDPSSATFVPGVPFGPEYCKGDIAFLHEEFPGSKMFFNSKILRQAILDSKEYLEKVLEIKISDVKEYKDPNQISMFEKPTEEPDEISEEVVQAVANAIVEEADEQGKDVQEVVNEIVEESKEDENTLDELYYSEVTEEPVAEEAPKTTRKRK